MKKMLIILSTSFLMLGVILLTSFQEVKAQENESYVNLASPDLTGKEYLGNGWYQIQLGAEYDRRYNVYTGAWYMDGVFPSRFAGSEMITFEINTLEDYVLTPVLISGTHNSTSDFRFRTVEQGYVTLNSEQTMNINNSTTLEWRSNVEGLVYNNAIIKLQLEKGTTATPYQVPIGALEQHSQIQYDKGYDNGFFDGYEGVYEQFYLFNFNKVQYTDYDGIDYSLGVFRTIEIDGNTTNLINSFADLISNRVSYFGQANVFYFVNDAYMYNYYLADYVLNSQGEQVLQVHTFLSSFYGIRIMENGISIIGLDNTNNNINNELIISKTYSSSQLTDTILVRSFHNEEFRKGYEQGKIEFGYNDNGTYISSLEYGTIQYNHGYDWGYDYGFDLGYDYGFNDGALEQDTTYKGVFSIITNAIFTPIALIFGIEILPNISLGMIILVPLLFGLIAFVVGGKKK